MTTRLPRLYLPDQPLHVIQRGNNHNLIFAADADYQFYLRRTYATMIMAPNSNVGLSSSDLEISAWREF